MYSKQKILSSIQSTERRRRRRRRRRKVGPTRRKAGHRGHALEEDIGTLTIASLLLSSHHKLKRSFVHVLMP
jgi:hypothetical protein